LGSQGGGAGTITIGDEDFYGAAPFMEREESKSLARNLRRRPRDHINVKKGKYDCRIEMR
jgi:hypothetical protein